MNNDITQQLLQEETRQKESLAFLLDRHLSRQGQLFVQTTQMGNTQGYLASVSLEWLASRVHFALQFPLFRRKYDNENYKLIPDYESLEELKQRPLDWSKQAYLAQYLTVVKNHKFPPILLVISQNWVNDSTAEKWDNNHRAKVNVDNFTALDKNNNIGFLNIGDDYQLFAIDGQHRLMGIKGLIELLRTGQLEVYDESKKSTRKSITLDDLIKEYELDLIALQSLASEKIGIEIIPSVLQGETYNSAKRRVKTIFANVQRTAVSLRKGQLILLDEDNGFSIIARRLAITHPLLKDRQEKDWNSRVNWDSATIASKSTVLTTLQALQDMTEGYLQPLFSQWSNKKNLINLRPDEEEIEKGLNLLSELFNGLASLPSYRKLEQGVKTYKLRRFKHDHGGGEGNFLFRPVGQIALAQALGVLVFTQNFNLESIIEKLIYFDEIGGFSYMDTSQSLWYGVLYNPMKKRIQVSGKKLASRLLIYLLGGMKDDLEKTAIRQALAEARTIEDLVTNQQQTMDFQGNVVTHEGIILPSVIIVK
ncbi:DGQHR domain-containing protein [Crocosphaera sp.]|uniref:DGQHR domain-containing protein n=1 Tax=Crocosphaera sp. TaxID=2729996 RepID=UPI00262B2D23|nr:DGQHR domain-containing protein [Crocosphaera sp.]MDJ0581682.1 DGQHR domain-containing protein [Crocosphaera sp.]